MSSSLLVKHQTDYDYAISRPSEFTSVIGKKIKHESQSKFKLKKDLMTTAGSDRDTLAQVARINFN